MDGVIMVNVPTGLKELGKDKNVINTDRWSDING
jgi:hypothetical protein